MNWRVLINLSRARGRAVVYLLLMAQSKIREFLNVYVETFGNPPALSLEIAIWRPFGRSEDPHLAAIFYSKKDFL
jgi:hypothetical protein